MGGLTSMTRQLARFARSTVASCAGGAGVARATYPRPRSRGALLPALHDEWHYYIGSCPVLLEGSLHWAGHVTARHVLDRIRRSIRTAGNAARADAERGPELSRRNA